MAAGRKCGLLVCAILALSTSAAWAETYIFTAVKPSGTVQDDPPYKEMSGNWGQYSIHSAVLTSGSRSRGPSLGGNNISWRIQPALQIAGGTYQFDITHGSSTSISEDLVVNISVSGGTLKDGLGNPLTSTTAYRRSGGDTWETVGILKLNAGVTQPIITLTTQPGYTLKFYVDGFRFGDVNPCGSGLPVLDAVNGPLAAGQTEVTVPDVAATATKVAVYANGTKIGEKTTGIVPGDNVVTVTPLVKGQQITATQFNGAGVESCPAPTGGIVGGGANPNIRVVLNIRENIFIAGPIGRDGSDITGDPFFLGSGGRVAGIGSAPSGGQIITPGGCWQTVSFSRNEDPSYGWAFVNPYTLLGDFGVLDGIGIALEGNDNGPYLVYIDDVMNGNVLIQDFETGTGEVMFQKPSTSTTTASYLMPVVGPAAPDSGQVTTAAAESGTQSFAAYWQFRDLSTSNWLLLTSTGTGTPQPVVDLNQPISFRILVLPVGQSSETGPTITDPPDSVTRQSGQSATFSVVATGTGTLNYQWYLDGTPVGANSPSFTLNGLVHSDTGKRVWVTICDATGSTRSLDAIITVPCRPFFADADGDGDVDQDDFGAFQACFSGPGGWVPPGDCLCFDHDLTAPDGDIDADDLDEFQKCITGPTVHVLPSACQP